MNYYMGIDLARKTDWTVATVIDGEGHVVACDRFHQISWSLQVERCASLYRTFHCTKAVVDSTGLGDVVVEQLEAQGLTVEAFIFTIPSRKSLIESLVLAFDNCEITIPSTDRFQVYRAELDSFEYTLDGSTIRYAAPPGHSDDCVMSLALAVHGWRSSRGAVLGVILMLERRAKGITDGIRDSFGELKVRPQPKPARPSAVAAFERGPVGMRVVSSKGEVQPPEKCPLCQGPRIWMSHGIGVLVKYCNQCHATNGVAAAVVGDDGKCPTCHEKYTQWAGGRPRCQNCGQPPDNDAGPKNGTTFAQYNQLRRGGRWGSQATG